MSRESWGPIYSEEERYLAGQIDKLTDEILLNKNDQRLINENREKISRLQRRFDKVHRENYWKL